MFLHRIAIVRNIYAYWIFFCLSSTESFSNEFINAKEAISIGGIQQWVSIKGSSAKPIFLFLHGGPGNSVMSYAHKFTRQLEPHFLMVHWDQRESGRTADLNQSGEALTLSLFIADAMELIQYLAKRFNKEKIYLAGHSWGGFLALQVAQKAPTLLTACIAISPMVHQIESERMSLQWMQLQAPKTENTVATAELSKIKVPFETANDLYLHRKWLALLSGGKAPPRAEPLWKVGRKNGCRFLTRLQALT
jgi:pimeloyl-ACP methyl ester carboxylesterase